MISFEDAKKAALALKQNIDTCVEFQDAFMFLCSTDPESDGGQSEPVVISKDTGKAISGSTYYVLKTAAGEKDGEKSVPLQKQKTGTDRRE